MTKSSPPSLPFTAAAASIKEATARFFTAAETGDMTVLADILARFPGAAQWRTEPAPDEKPFGAHQTALIAAAERGHTDAVRLLLKHGADVNAQHDRGWTALMHAAWAGHDAVVEALTWHRADTKIRNENDADAATLARMRAHHDIGARIEKSGKEDNLAGYHSGLASATKALKPFRPKR
ncbi:MAG: ankyrin repeat domain-containing protein [Micavibrio sp.]|nr:ankyrin repeat domain-containing protein [Micavibrio sp.]